MESSGTTYRDEKGYDIAVGAGLGGDKHFTKRFVPGHSGTRVKSPSLPLRDTSEEAQADLDAYAEKKGWKPKGQEEKRVALVGPSVVKKPQSEVYVPKSQIGLL